MAILENDYGNGIKRYQDNLIKHICCSCYNDFIVGENISKAKKVLMCPFCGSTKLSQKSAKATNEMLARMSLQGFGIYYEKDCKNKISPEKEFKKYQEILWLEIEKK